MARQYGASGKGGKKRSAESLKADNAGVKDGTIRKGKGGKTVRRYNANTGRWDILRVIDKKGRTKVTKKIIKTPDSPASESPDKNVGLGGSAAPYRRPGQRPAEENVVKGQAGKGAKPQKTPLKVEPEVKDTSKSGKKIPIGRIVLRGWPPKKYQWNGQRFEPYDGPRSPSPKRS
jgi:uncharacterized protein RhaS with RHS repeats